MEPSETPQQKQNKFMIRTQIMKRMTEPREIKSAVLKIISAEYIRKKYKLTIIPGDDFIDDITNQVIAKVAELGEDSDQAEKLLKKDEGGTLSSAYQDQRILLSLAIRQTLSKKFRVDIEELNEKLVNNLLGFQSEEKEAESAGTILIVEDTLQTRRVLKTFLSKRGYKVVEAEDGERGFAKLKDEKYDLILLDLNMPKMNGKVFLKNIKGNPSFKDIPVVIITSQGDSETIRTMLQMGARDFIVKPFKSTTVMDKVDNIVEAYRKS